MADGLGYSMAQNPHIGCWLHLSLMNCYFEAVDTLKIRLRLFWSCKIIEG